MNVHTFKIKADYWTWCPLLPGKRTHGLYWKTFFWENLITETANSSRLIFQLFSQSCSYGNPLISSIFLISLGFYWQSTLLIIFTCLCVKCLDVQFFADPFLSTTQLVLQTVKRKKQLCSSNDSGQHVCSFTTTGNKVGRENEREALRCSHPQQPLWCYQETKWAFLSLSFSQERPTHSVSVLQKSFIIVYFRPIFLGDIKFLLSAAENKTTLKVRGKLILFVTVAVMWGEDFKLSSLGHLQVSEYNHSAKCEWTHMSI